MGAATGARDGRLRIWDVTSSEKLATVDAHDDCMKFLSPAFGGTDSWISGGYDGKMRLWDLRVGDVGGVAKPALCMDHAHSIETAVTFPGGAMIGSAGGTVVKLWDLAAGGRLVQALPDAHSKAITCLCLDSKASVLLTASFDCFAKVYHVAGLDHVFTYRLPAPIVCAAWRPDDRSFAFGLDNGQWQVRHRRTEEEVVADQKRKSEIANAAKAKKSILRRKAIGNLRGMDREAASDEEIVEEERPKKKRETQVDFFFRKFEYLKVAEVLITPGTSAAHGFAIVDELVQRGALKVALGDRDEAFCLQALKWLLKQYAPGNAFQNHLFFEMLHTLLNSNSCLQPPNTPELLKMLGDIDAKVAEEISCNAALAETAGMLQAIMSL